MKKLCLCCIILILIGIGASIDIPANPSIDVYDTHIVKEKMKLIENSGVSNYNNYHFIFNYDKHPYDCDMYAILKFYDKKNKFLGQENISVYGWGQDIFLGKNKKVKKVKVLVYRAEDNFIYDILGYKKLLYNETITEVVKNSTVHDNTYVEPEPEPVSTGDDEDDYYSSYDSYYSSSYDSYYDSDYSGNSYASEPVSGGSYVASKNSDKFHTSSCGHGERIKSSNRIYFSSRDEAINSGYEPCAHCNP